MKELSPKEFTKLKKRVAELEGEQPHLSEDAWVSLFINWFLTIILVIVVIGLVYSLSQDEDKIDALQNNVQFLSSSQASMACEVQHADGTMTIYTNCNSF